MLYDRDFRILTDLELKQWEKAKLYMDKARKQKQGLSIKQFYRFHELMPNAAYHYESIFPNNFLNTKHLEDVDRLKKNQESFRLLLDSGPSERELLNFITKNKAYFLIGSILKTSYDFGHHGAYAFKEFELPPNFIADYLLIGKNSGGHEFVFVELESPIGAVINADGSFGTVIRKGLRQIEDWDAWLESNFSHLVLQFEKYQGSYEPLSKEFLSLDKSRIHYVVIAGRRRDFKDKTYRLKRKLFREQNILLLHYDNLLDGVELFFNSGNY